MESSEIKHVREKQGRHMAGIQEEAKRFCAHRLCGQDFYKTRCNDEPDTCNLHNRKFELYCVTCGELLCGLCLNEVTHKSHKIFLGNAALHTIFSFKKASREAEDRIRQLEELSLKLNFMMESIAQEKEAAILDIDKQEEILIQAIKCRMNILRKKITDINNSQALPLKSHQEKVLLIKDEMKKMKNEANITVYQPDNSDANPVNFVNRFEEVSNVSRVLLEKKFPGPDFFSVDFEGPDLNAVGIVRLKSTSEKRKST